jgi:hypothetical protein
MELTACWWPMLYERSLWGFWIPWAGMRSACAFSCVRFLGSSRRFRRSSQDPITLITHHHDARLLNIATFSSDRGNLHFLVTSRSHGVPVKNKVSCDVSPVPFDVRLMFLSLPVPIRSKLRRLHGRQDL